MTSIPVPEAELECLITFILLFSALAPLMSTVIQNQRDGGTERWLRRVMPSSVCRKGAGGSDHFELHKRGLLDEWSF